jgi:putative membrane protein
MAIGSMALTTGALAQDNSANQTNSGQQSGSSAQSNDTNRSSSANRTSEMGTKPSGDQGFVMKAAQGGLAEVELGNLAKQKASSDDVKQFGQRMADDHSKANEELKSWASKNGITLPTELDAKHKAEQARIAKLSGAAFDRAYITLMVADHNKDVAEFQRESKTAKDPDLKAWAGKTLPTLEEHQKLAKEISAKVAAAPSNDAKK